MRELPSNSHSHQHGMGGRPHWLLLFPADTTLPLIRVPLGYYIVHPKQAITRTVLLIVLPLIWWWFYVGFTNEPMPGNAGHLWLMGFAVLSLAVSLAVFVKRALGWRRGEEIHSEEAGYSWLCWHTPLPVWLCELFIVPGLVAGAGWGFAHTVSTELGYWLMVSAASLLLMGTWERARMRNAMVTTRDGMLQAQSSGWRVEQQEARARGRASAPNASEPHFAELGGGPATGPDAMSFGRDTGAMTPERMTWFRKRKGVGMPRGPGERRDYADLG